MTNGLFDNVYNPDVLSCLANLSNDEVFTPPEVVNQMLDMLPQELFRNPDTKFLDPACKTGVFLREIAKRLIVGLEPQIPELQERIDHIFHNQLYGIAITELTSLLSRRGVYCSKYPQSEFSVSKFENAEGNIKFKKIQHTWDPKELMRDLNGKKIGKCVWCGASREEYDRSSDLETHAYEWIHVENPEEIFKMKFDVIIGNPPYQLSDGGSGPSAMPLYNKFVEQAMKLRPQYLSMIIPARWFAGGKGLDDFRDSMLNDPHMEVLVDYESSKDCFEGVDIAGGICYFLWKQSFDGECKVVNMSSTVLSSTYRRLNEYPVFIRSNNAVSIVRKVQQVESEYLDEMVLSQKPFGFRTFARGEETPFPDAVKLLSSKGFGYVSKGEISKNVELLDKYKVIIGRLVPSNGEVDVRPGEGYRVITSPQILRPNEICSESYIVIGYFDAEEEANNFAQYMCCKLPRFLLRQSISSMNVNREAFRFVPLQDFNQAWMDNDLYDKYKLTKEEIAFVELMMKPMDLNGGDDNG